MSPSLFLSVHTGRRQSSATSRESFHQTLPFWQPWLGLLASGTVRNTCPSLKSFGLWCSVIAADWQRQKGPNLLLKGLDTEVTRQVGLPRGTLRGKGPACRSRRHGFNPSVWKIPWGRKWQPTPVFLPGEFNGQRSLVGYSPWGCKELDTTEHAHTQTYWLKIDNIMVNIRDIVKYYRRERRCFYWLIICLWASLVALW